MGLNPQSAGADFVQFRDTGSARALARVFDAVAPELLLVAGHLAVAGIDAEDLVHATFLDAVEHAARYDGSRPLVPWLVGILIRRARAERRRLARRVDPRRLPERRVEDPAERAEIAELGAQITAALDALPTHYRQALVLRLVHGLTPEQIAGALGCPVATVKSRLARGREIVKRALPASIASAALAALVPGRGLARVREAVLSTARATARVTTLAGGAGVFAMKKSLAVAASLIVIGALVWNLWPGPRANVAPGRTHAAPNAQVPLGDASAVRSDTMENRAQRVPVAVAANPTHNVFTVRVVDVAARPLADARVVRWSNDGRSEEQTTAATGTVAFPPLAKSGGIVVLVHAVPPVTLELETLTGEHQILAGGDAVLAGWVRVDGQPPREPLELELLSALELPEVVPVALRSELWSAGKVTQATAADGSFRFANLSAKWQGRIGWRWTHWLAHAHDGVEVYARSLWFPAPRDDVTLELTKLPLLRGRVLWEDTRKPVADARVVARALFADGSHSPFKHMSVDEGGRFVAGVAPGSRARMASWRDPSNRVAISEVEVRASARLAASGVRLVFAAKDMHPPGDVGDIALRRGAELSFLVENTNGEPIRDAVVWGTALSAPTDARGHTSLVEGDASKRRFTAGALGYGIAEVDVTSGVGTAQSPFVVRLAAAPRFTVRVRDSAGNVPDGIRVRIESKEPPFAGSEQWWPTELLRAVGQKLYRGGGPTRLGSKSGGHVSFQLGTGGEVPVPGLRPGAALVVSATARDACLVERRVTVTQEPQLQHQLVELVVTQPCIRVAGRVVDQNGAGIARVRVTLEQGKTQRLDFSDDDGRFCIEPLYATGERVELAACHADFAPLRLDPFRLTAEMHPIELRLAPGYQVTAKVVDQRGAVVPGTLIRIDGVETSGLDPEHLAPGTTRFSGLPLADVVFSTTIGGQSFECRHSTAVAEARIQVPLVGTLEVSAPPPSRDDIQLRARVLDASGAELTAFSVNAAGTRMTSGRQLMIPGRYVVELVARENGDRGEGARERREIEIEAGRHTRCVFARAR